MISGKMFIYMVMMIIIQLVFGSIDLYFALSEPHSACMDNEANILVVRSWFKNMGIIQLIMSAVLGLTLASFLMGCVPFEISSKIMIAAMMVSALAIVVWTVVELLLFWYVIADQCSGLFYLYSFLLAISNGYKVISSCCCSGNNR